SRLVANFDKRLPVLTSLVREGGARARELSLTLGAIGAKRGADLDDALRLLEAGLDGGRFVSDGGLESIPLGLAAMALVANDETARAARLVEDTLLEATRVGSAYGYMSAVLFRGFMAARRGDLVDVEADLRLALELIG